MTAIANLTVKNGAATPVDVTFTAVTPASGFGSIAIWQVIAGAARSMYRTFTTSVARNGAGTTIVKTKLTIPSFYTDPVSGLPILRSQAEVNVDVRVPKDFPVSELDDVAAFAGNLLSTALIKDVIKTGTPVT